MKFAKVSYAQERLEAAQNSFRYSSTKLGGPTPDELGKKVDYCIQGLYSLNVGLTQLCYALMDFDRRLPPEPPAIPLNAGILQTQIRPGR